MVKVSVVVSVYSKERSRHLLDCIDSLREQSVKPFEVIVVLDAEPELIDFYKSKLSDDVRIIVSDGFGLSNARNTGVKNAMGDIIAFIDDDAVADKWWLENLLKNYNDPEVVGVGGLIKPLWKSNRPKWFPEELDWVIGCSYKGLPEFKTFVRNPLGCNMSFRREVFERIGCFRSDIGRFGKRLLSGEETEFSVRILKMLPYAKIVYDPSAVVYHKISENRLCLRYLFVRSVNEGISKAIISNLSGSSFLSTENRYLRYLFRAFVPSRLRRFYNLASLSQMIVLYLSLSGVFLGFVSQKFLKLWNSSG
jgi:glycosyltransferase involved in cell wall biosynthesis